MRASSSNQLICDKNVFVIIPAEIVSIVFVHPIKKGGAAMKQNEDKTSEGLNEIFEIINAKGDTGELKEIVDRYDSDNPEEDSNW